MIIIYTSDNCKWCDRTKVMLAEAGFAFEERNVGTAGSTYLVEWGAIVSNDLKKTVPQVMVDGERIGGYEMTKEWLRRR